MNDFDTLTFAEHVRSTRDSLDPMASALAFAREIAYPTLAPSAWLEELQRLADGARPAVGLASNTRGKVEALNDYVFNQLGFRGNSEDYYNPANSYINEVLTRRTGIPISLSLIYVDVARRLGLPAKGIGLPGHFIAGVRNAGKRILVDTFNGGKILSEADCEALVRRLTSSSGPFQPRWLEPTPVREIIARMLNNLRNVYAEREAWAECIAVVRCLHALQPESIEHTRDLGLLFYRGGRLRDSITQLEKYLTKKPNASDFDQVKSSLGKMIDQVARLN